MGKRRRQSKGGTGGGFQVAPGVLVTLAYELYDAEGEFVEGSDPAFAVAFVFGYGQVAPALERALSGMSAGQACRVRLRPEEAFGHRDPKATIEVARSEIPEGIGLGDEIEADAENGEEMVLRVVELNDEVAVLDTNHPLAGQSVEVDLFVESVRPATPEELETAERLLASAAGDRPGTLIPAERLLKRDEPEAAPGGPTADP